MELPRLEPLWQKYRDQGFTVIAIETSRDREQAQEFVADNNLTYHFLEDVEGEGNVAEDRLQMYGQPSTYLVDRHGQILYYHLGFDAGDEVKMEEEIQLLLKS